MDGRDLDVQLMHVSRQALEYGPDALAALPQGVRAVDSWENERYGGVLFWIDASWNLHGRNAAALRETLLHRDGLSWRSMAVGGSGTATAEELAAEKGPGLHRLSETTVAPVRLVRAFASPEVFTIELRHARASVPRRPGGDGLCLRGITDGDPITYAYALDRHGRPLPGDPLRLWTVGGDKLPLLSGQRAKQQPRLSGCYGEAISGLRARTFGSGAAESGGRPLTETVEPVGESAPAHCWSAPPVLAT